MKIGIDIRAAIQEPAGIGTLALNLTREIASLDADNEYYLYGNAAFDLDVQAKNIHHVTMSFGASPMGGMLWHAAAFIDVRYLRRLDAFISFGSLQMAAMTNRFVVLVIPDLSHILFPEYHVAKSRFTGKVLMRMALARAKRVIAISEHTKQDILRYMNGRIRDTDVSVAYAACEDLYRRGPSAEDLDRVRKKYGLDRKYVLAVGTLEPRKNIGTLIKAFAEVAHVERYDLVVAGKRGWFYENLFEEVKKSGVEGRVKFLGFVPQADMPALYAGAEVFVYPTLYEGFGIPPLEAMTCGVPVITSNVSSLPEVTGDAAILIDPYNVSELTAQLQKLLNDPVLRKHYGKSGREQAQRFSWKSFTEHVLSATRG